MQRELNLSATVVPTFDDPYLLKLLGWADRFRKLEVWANADHPRDAERARLEMLADELRSVYAEIPEHDDAFADGEASGVQDRFRHGPVVGHERAELHVDALRRWNEVSVANRGPQQPLGDGQRRLRRHALVGVQPPRLALLRQVVGVRGGGWGGKRSTKPNGGCADLRSFCPRR